MRILLVRPRSSGGLSAHVDQELALLRESGHEVAEAPVRIQERPAPLADLRTLRTLRRCAREAAPVVVHAHGLRAGALTALALAGTGIDLVLTLHNLPVGSSSVRLLGRGLLQVAARGSRTVLAVSPDLEQAARRAGARDVRRAVVPAPERTPRDAAGGDSGGKHVPDAATGHPAEAADDSAWPVEDALRVLVIARLATQKGLGDLLDAAALLPAEPPVQIAVAGDGPLHDELAARIDRERLPVRLLGRREDVPALLGSCDLVVSAAHWEGQPVALQEALRAGRAIVATDAGGTRWVTGEAAHLVPVGDVPALAAAITTHTDPAVRRRAEEASRRRADELPSAGDMIDQLTDVLALAGPR